MPLPCAKHAVAMCSFAEFLVACSPSCIEQRGIINSLEGLVCCCVDYAEGMVQLSGFVVAAERLQRLLVSIRHCSGRVDALQVQHTTCSTVFSMNHCAHMHAYIYNKSMTNIVLISFMRFAPLTGNTQQSALPYMCRHTILGPHMVTLLQLTCTMQPVQLLRSQQVSHAYPWHSCHPTCIASMASL